MHHTPNPGSFMAPEWFVFSLAAVFFAGACFYLYRLFAVTAVKKAYGYHDWENEIGHGICMLAMASSLAPAAFKLPTVFWTVSLSAGAVWFTARALTWGRKLPYNKAWWDWAHVGMLGGMALMFHPLNLGSWFTGLQIAFWLWFSGLYAYETYHELKAPKAFSLGSNLSHLLMGVVMLVMTLWPMALMPMHHMGSASQPMVVQPQAAPAGLPVVKADDVNFQAEAVQASSSLPVVILVHGGCDKCNTELPIFQRLSAQYAGRVKFVTVHEDLAPNTCKLLQVSKCPCVVVLSKGIVTKQRLPIEADEAQLRAFVDNVLKN